MDKRARLQENITTRTVNHGYRSINVFSLVLACSTLRRCSHANF